MNKKLLVAAIASALVSPAAFAAEGADGMTYTSASEGFYGSLRARYDTGSVEDDEGGINFGTTSRIGVRGTLDLGNGLTGSYQWETNVSGGGQGAATGKRQGNVGISGGFGSVTFGSQTDTLIDVSGRTDVTNSVSGNYDLTPGGSYRVDNSVVYRTPNLNGFDASLRLVAADTTVVTDGAVTTADENLVDDWALTANYAIQGLSASAAYRTEVDGLAGGVITGLGADGEITGTDNTVSSADDSNSWGFGLGYGQDNWNVAGWYGVTEARLNTDAVAVAGTNNDTAGTVLDYDINTFSVAGDVTVGKTKVYAFTESREWDRQGGPEDTVSGVGVMYSFTTQSRVWIDYQANDHESSNIEDDKVVIGLRYDF